MTPLKTTGPEDTTCLSPARELPCLTHKTSFPWCPALPCPAQSQPSAANAVLALAALILQRENQQLLLGPECRIYTQLEMPQK